MLPATMHNARNWSFWALIAASLCSSACRGCSKSTAPAAAAVTETESRHSQLLARIADLKVDRTKVYPKDETGTVTCGDDALCFVAQAETCTKAKVQYKLTMSGYGFHDVVDAVYTITGSESERCRMTRRVTEAESHIDQTLIEALRASGKSEADIALSQTEATTRLRRMTPLSLDCWFGNDDVLEVALDLAQQRYNDKLYRLGCHEKQDDATKLGANATRDGAVPDAAAAAEGSALEAAPAQAPAAEHSAAKTNKASAKTAAKIDAKAGAKAASAKEKPKPAAKAEGKPEAAPAAPK
jgi:hypothetical protein